MSKMHDLFSNSAVANFGAALRYAIGKREYGGAEDYTSLVELEYVEKMDQFIEVLKKFLRRYDSQTRRYERERPGKFAFKPSDKDLKDLIMLAESYGVKIVSAALIAHALVRPEKGE
jgi:hypothetical protein